MHNSRFDKVALIYALLCFCFLATYAPSVRAQDPREIGVMIDEFIMNDEFKLPERAKLRALPIEAVGILTERLNQLDPDSPGELRIYDCLAIKIEQFSGVLDQEIKAAALSALKAKTLREDSQLHSHRMRLYGAASTPSKTEAPTLSQSTNVPTPPVHPQPPAPMTVPSTHQPTTHSEGPTSSKPWSIIVVLIVVTCGLLWLLPKRGP